MKYKTELIGLLILIAVYLVGVGTGINFEEEMCLEATEVSWEVKTRSYMEDGRYGFEIWNGEGWIDFSNNK